MHWRKLGQVFAGASGPDPALLSHAALPVPYPLGGDLVRVFYSGRDANNRSAVGSVVIRLGDQPKVEEADPRPVLLPGAPATFDDAGVSIGCIVPGPDGDRLYYMGWNLSRSMPWRNAIGVAFGNAAQARFEQRFAGPVLDRAPQDPFTLSYPCVLNPAPGDWRLWYGTSPSWSDDPAEMYHGLRTATSCDGLNWKRAEALCLPPEAPEVALLRPSVLALPQGGYEMYFSARSATGPYVVGRALSDDGEAWQRVPAGISPGAEPWESGSLAYPAVFEQAGRRWLLYNGRGYGATGFGLAVWEAG